MSAVLALVVGWAAGSIASGVVMLAAGMAIGRSQGVHALRRARRQWRGWQGRAVRAEQAVVALSDVALTSTPPVADAEDIMAIVAALQGQVDAEDDERMRELGGQFADQVAEYLRRRSD